MNLRFPPQTMEKKMDWKQFPGKSRHGRLWPLLTAISMIVCTVVFYRAFCSRNDVVRVAPEGNDDGAEPWRLDTTRNYAIDLEYWLQPRQPQERHYYFHVSTMEEKHPDGVARTLMVINGQYPGPIIEANSGDTIVIHVENLMESDPVTIHCHGLLFKDQAFNDGASFINQCPIPPGGSYEYRIELDADQYGTYWYHSHYGTQYADGLFGPLVIHSRDEYEDLDYSYDKELVVLVNDYYHDVGYTYLPSYLGPDNENVEPVPDNGLIQGQNHFNYVESAYMVPHGGNVSGEEPTPVSPTVFNLDPGSIYRIRVINAGFFMPFEIEVDGHLLEVVEADGSLVEPIEVPSLTMSVAQRYSFILLPQEKDFASKNYWMHAQFNQFCTKEENPNFEMDVKAVVSYTVDSNVVEPTTYNYNGGDLRCRDFDQGKLKALNSQVPKVANGSNLPDLRLDIDILFMIGAYQMARGYLNDKTYLPLQNGSTMYQSVYGAGANSVNDLNDDELFTFNDNQYMINLNQRGQIVDIVLNNYDDGAHPFHLHGHKFWVLAIGDSGYFEDEYYHEEDHVGSKMNFQNAVLRDTVNIPAFGWGVIRFVVDNPGVWPFHCHIGWHMESGLLLQINALQDEYSNWNNFPKDWSLQCKYWQDKL